MQLEERVRSLIVDNMNVDASAVTADAAFIEDLGADSLDLAELMMSFESEFDITIPDSDAEKMSTVGDAIEYLKQRLENEEQA